MGGKKLKDEKLDLLIDLLKKASLFKELREEELKLLASASCLKSFSDGECIFGHGTNGDALFIVKSGTVRIVDPKTDDQTDVARFIAGDLFGELDLFEESPRAYDALSEGETELLIFPKPGLQFEALLEKNPALFARVLTKLLSQIAHRIREANKLVSEKAPWIEDLRKQLFYDKLTGLLNKTYFDEELQKELLQNKEQVFFLAIKPDNFKTINDTYGHEAGDKTLCALAKTTCELLGKQGIILRMRGDELFAVLRKIEKTAAQELAEKILDAVRKIDLRLITGQRDFFLTVALGLASYPQEAGSPAEALELAFNRMFLARQAGGNRLVGVATR